MSLSVDSVVELISSAAPLTFLVAVVAGIFGNIVSGFVFRKRLKELHINMDDIVVTIEEHNHIRKRIELNTEELKRMLVLVESLEMANANSAELAPSKSTDLAAKIGEYLSNRGPMDSLLKEVAK